jgi:Zn-dependent M28 family amino/carboxypeptidase
MGEIVARAGAKMGVTVSPDPMPEEQFFLRSDHYSFVKQGVPSVMLATGSKNDGARIFRDFLATKYHTPADQIDLPFDWASAAKFADVNYLVARDLADAASAPRWYADSPFAAQFAKDQPKATRRAK